MPQLFLNLDALSHNAALTVANAGRWGVSVLPVLKAAASHPLAVATLMRHGFTRFGFAECTEAQAFEGHSPAEKVMICLTPLRQASLVATRFSRSAVSTVEMLQALQGAAEAAGKIHDVLAMIDIGDAREGINSEDTAEFIDVFSSFPNLSLCGFGSMFACFGREFPDPAAIARLEALKTLFREKGISDPVVSVGGSVICSWLESHKAGPITEVRLGDPFLLGADIYRHGDLPGGPYRRDVCVFCAEVLEIHERTVVATAMPPEYYTVSQDTSFFTHKEGRRRRALLDLGFFHTEGKELACTLPGTFIAECSSGYTALDVTDCPVPVAVGNEVFFTASYWSLSKSFRSSAMPVLPVTDDAWSR